MNGRELDLTGRKPPKDFTRWVILVGVWLLYTTFGVSAASLAPLVSSIEADLGISHAAMGAVLGVWQFVYIGAAIPCGLLLDRIGTRHAFTLGALLMAGSALGRSFAEDHTQLLLTVGLFGLGGPIISAGAPKVVAEWFEGRRRGLAMGIYITGPGIGAALSLSLTNSILMPWLENDWRLVLRFWGALSFIPVVTWFAISWLPELRRSHQNISGRWSSTIISLLHLQGVRIVLFMSIGVLFFTHGLGNWLPELLRSGGMPMDQAGFWATVPVVIAIFGALLIPRLAIPSRRIFVLLMLFLCAMGASLLLRGMIGPTFIAGLVLDGLARSSMMIVLILTLVEIEGVGKERAGTAGGLFFAAAEIGGVSGPVILGILYDATGDFSAGLGLLTLVSLFLLALLVLLKKHVWLS